MSQGGYNDGNQYLIQGFQDVYHVRPINNGPIQQEYMNYELQPHDYFSQFQSPILKRDGNDSIARQKFDKGLTDGLIDDQLKNLQKTENAFSKDEKETNRKKMIGMIIGIALAVIMAITLIAIAVSPGGLAAIPAAGRAIMGSILAIGAIVGVYCGISRANSEQYKQEEQTSKMRTKTISSSNAHTADLADQSRDTSVSSKDALSAYVTTSKAASQLSSANTAKNLAAWNADDVDENMIQQGIEWSTKHKNILNEVPNLDTNKNQETQGLNGYI